LVRSFVTEIKIDVTVPPWAAMTSATIADPEPAPPPWPDPWPTTFGYHEFVHACTALAVICQYIALWYAVF
jgi:predicted membrane channel-forming protein YqfA (hemolysin III family)